MGYMVPMGHLFRAAYGNSRLQVMPLAFWDDRHRNSPWSSVWSTLGGQAPGFLESVETYDGCLGGGFKYLVVSPLFGEDSHFDEYFSKGLTPPTRCFFDGKMIVLVQNTTPPEIMWRMDFPQKMMGSWATCISRFNYGGTVWVSMRLFYPIEVGRSLRLEHWFNDSMGIQQNMLTIGLLGWILRTLFVLFVETDCFSTCFWKTPDVTWLNVQHVHSPSIQSCWVMEVELNVGLSRIQLDVSKNNGTPKSSILIGFSLIFTIHFGGFSPYFRKHPVLTTPKISKSLPWSPVFVFLSWTPQVWSETGRFLGGEKIPTNTFGAGGKSRECFLGISELRNGRKIPGRKCFLFDLMVSIEIHVASMYSIFTCIHV